MKQNSDQEPLLPLTQQHVDTKDYGSLSFANRDGYSISPAGLASIVSEQQVGALKAYNGVQGLASTIVLSENNTLKDGLSTTDDSIERLRGIYGTNALPLPPAPDLLELILAALSDPTMLMLLASAIVSLVLGLGVEQDWDKGWIEGTSIIVTIGLVVSVAAGTDYSKAQEFRNQQIQLEQAKHIYVVRNGRSVMIPPALVVVADVVRLSVGDICPADGVLVQASADLQIDESALTGESKLVAKTVWNPHTAGGDPFIVSGTNIMQGTGLFFVLAVGSNSIQGKILARVREQQGQNDDEEQGQEANSRTGGGCLPALKDFFTFGGGDQGAGLMEKLDVLAVDIGKIGLIVALVVFFVLLLGWIYTEFVVDATCSPLVVDNEDMTACLTNSKCAVHHGTCHRQFHVDDVATILDYFITAITILVVAVPEGLPLAVTLALAVSMGRMMKDQNQVKHMDSTETMGSATTICSDKTGTLTENKMTTMRATFAGELYEHVVSTSGPSSLGILMTRKLRNAPKSMQLLSEAILLNVSPTSKVAFDYRGDALYEGNPTDCALINLTAQLGFDMEAVRAPFKVDGSMLDWGIHQIPFSSERKRMMWIVQRPSSDAGALPYRHPYRLYCKGAPRQVLDACSYIVSSVSVKGDPETKKFDERRKQDIMDLVSDWQDRGLRTLAIAYCDIKDRPRNGWDRATTKELETGMTLLAVVGIEDPLRASVPGAIMQCHKSGIDVRMCTGDALSTAIAIAKGCNILRNCDLDKAGVPKVGFAMTGAEFDDRVHKKDPSKPQIVRRVFDPKIKDAVDSLAEQFLLDDSGNKVLDQRAFDDVWPTLRVLARCQPEDKVCIS
jgi:magnesium-transporting ATPase (P-type)